MKNQRQPTQPQPQSQEGAFERAMRLAYGGRRAPTSNAEALGMGAQKILLPLLMQGIQEWISNYKERGAIKNKPDPPEPNTDAISTAVRGALLGDVPDLPATNQDWSDALEANARADLDDRFSGNLFADQSDWDWRKKLFGGGF